MFSINVLNIANQTNTGTVLGATTDFSRVTVISYQATFTDAAAAGTIKLQASNDAPATPPAVSDWNDIAGSSMTVAAGATTLSAQINVSYQYIRAVFVSTGGAGTVAVRLVAMGA